MGGSPHLLWAFAVLLLLIGGWWLIFNQGKKVEKANQIAKSAEVVTAQHQDTIRSLETELTILKSRAASRSKVISEAPKILKESRCSPEFYQTTNKLLKK